jgi:hypothetical protein
VGAAADDAVLPSDDDGPTQAPRPWLGSYAFVSPAGATDGGGGEGRYDAAQRPVSFGTGFEVGVDVLPSFGPSLGYEVEEVLDLEPESNDSVTEAISIHVPIRLRLFGFGTRTLRVSPVVAGAYSRSWDLNQDSSLVSGSKLVSDGASLELGVVFHLPLAGERRLELGLAARGTFLTTENGLGYLADVPLQRGFLTLRAGLQQLLGRAAAAR